MATDSESSMYTSYDSSTSLETGPSNYSLRGPHAFPPLKNDLLLRAARGEKTERAPVWVMRQAGRYLPEFREVRAKHEFFEVCRTPALATLVTLQPIDRYAGLLDGSIIFSDILVIPQALGMEVLMTPGPHFPSPLRTPEDIRALLDRTKDIDAACRTLNYVYEAVTMTRQKLVGRCPLLGFAGAPWTLFAYMTEGGSGSKTSFQQSKQLLLQQPALATELLSRLADVCAVHLANQIQAGAQMCQVFDSWAGELSPYDFRAFSLPHLRTVARKTNKILADRNVPSVPLIVFARGVHQADLLRDLAAEDVGYQIVSLDWNLTPSVTRAAVGERVCLQGNLDPTVLYGGETAIKAAVKRMFDPADGGFGDGAKGGHIANLGHGITPGVDPEMMRCFLQAVHDEGRKAHA